MTSSFWEADPQACPRRWLPGAGTKACWWWETAGRTAPLARAERVDNYLGLPGVTGMELLEQFRRHAEEMGADFVLGRVISLMAWNGFHLTVGSELYEGETLILAPGVVRQAKYPGEAEYLGRGVSYCATCDGMLYRGKPVAVVGRSGDAPREASYLKSLGCQVVYAAAQRPDALEEGIPFIQANRLAITGEQTVTALVADGAPIPCSGIFILRDAVAPTDLLPQLETQGGSIRVDRSMATSIPGVFAAGDCTGGPLQVSKAVGEGLIAALSAAEFLDRRGTESPAEISGGT